MTRITSLYGPQTSPMVFCIQNGDFSTTIASLYRSQNTSVALCMQNRVISSRITSLYGSQPSFVFFACISATLGQELQVSVGPRPHLWFFAFKRRLEHQNCKSLWVPASSVVLCIHNSAIMTRINSLCGSQSSPVLLYMQNNVISIRPTSLYGSQPSFVVFACKTAAFGPEIQVSLECQTSPIVFCIQNGDISTRFLRIPALICGFVHSQQRHYDQN